MNEKNLRLLILVCIVSMFNSYAYAQMPVEDQSHNRYTVLDSAGYIITYEMSAIHNKAKPNDKSRDVQILQIGRKISKTFSKPLYDNDSVCTALLKKGVTAIPIYQDLVSPEDIYKNYPVGKITVSYRTFMGGPVLKYEEGMPAFKWQMMPERKTVLNYQCQKAVTTYRGRDYTAWFTTAIPIPEGPWKFGGLPGLIMQITDSKNEYEYMCIGIQKILSKKQPIKFWKWDYQNTTREKARTLLKNMHEKPNEFLKATTGDGIHIIGGGNPDMLKYPYNPIELE